MRYLILIHSNPRSRALWETLTDEQRMEFGRGYMALSAEIEAAGEMVISNGLTDLALAKRVWVQDGETMTSDGPFAEVKEYVAGFLLLDTETEQQALAWAAKTPDAQLGGAVEVRPLLDMSTLDL
ncbi:YciI family protein [Kutzneria chonburiensis]|uniref:YciI family protein n=1 Tax=Kutzneria chonburiensis TaxID=1483604 RepID=A0ABV6MRU2_9PSEU|nr:YciI family protein [Kutzneria chonburiensis]